MEGDTPVNILSDALQNTEDLIREVATDPDMDPQAKKTLEDINALILAARYLGRNKGIADRLQKITIESEQALKQIRGPGVSEATKETTENILNNYTHHWRPLFYLLMSSRDFRQLILDTLRISKRVIYSYGDDLSHESFVGQKFVEGAPVKEMAESMRDKAQQKGVPQMSEEEWNVLQDDIQKVLVLLSKEPSYREGIERVFSLLDTFQKSVTEAPILSTPENVHIRRVIDETEDLVASFSGKDSFDRFKNHLKNLVTQVQKDERLQSYLTELKEFVLKAKSEEEVQTEEFKQQSKDLAYRGRELMRELREKEDLDPFFKSGEEMLDNIKNDEFLQQLRQQAGIVKSDLSYVDSQGNTQVDTNMLSKLQIALVPILVETLKYIPIPKIQYSDKDTEFCLDNVVLCSYDVVPEDIRFHLESDSQLSLKDIEVKSNTFLVISLNRIRTELKDIEFYFKKKTFPTFEEKGRVTFRIKGEGSKLSFTYKLEQGPQDTIPKIKEGFASFNISDINIDFDTKTLDHPVLVPVLTNIFKTQIRREIEAKVERNLNGFIGKLGDMVTTSLSETNLSKCPFFSGIHTAKQTVQNTHLAQALEKRREILE
jgi:hypothetical protein